MHLISALQIEQLSSIDAEGIDWQVTLPGIINFSPNSSTLLSNYSLLIPLGTAAWITRTQGMDNVYHNVCHGWSSYPCLLHERSFLTSFWSIKKWARCLLTIFSYLMWLFLTKQQELIFFHFNLMNGQNEAIRQTETTDISFSDSISRPVVTV